MALDGIVLSNIASDFHSAILGGRILKIYQTELDEIIIGVRAKGVNYKILLTAHSNYPRIHFTEIDKENPQTPPMFCMLLRKHLGGGRIIDIVQPNFERILEIHVESTNELGDLTTKKLIIEIMGRHSNIMLTDEDDIIIDSIKHIGRMQSSVREVFPGKTYVYPPSQDKLNPIYRTYESFISKLDELEDNKIHKQLYTIYSGMSPQVAREICYRSNLDNNIKSSTLTTEQKQTLYKELDNLYTSIENKDYLPAIYKDVDDKIIGFSSIKLTSFDQLDCTVFDNASLLLEYFYSNQSESSRVSQKTANMKRTLQIHYERALRKKEIQLNALDKVAKREQYRIWGELLTANVHSVPEHTNSFTTINYYDENLSEITIPLNPKKTPIKNAQDYFKIYNKAKRTEVAAKAQLKTIESDLYYLESLFSTLETLETESDIEEFRLELVSSGYLKPKRVKGQVKKKKPKPLHFISSDGFDIFVGKNNTQNDHLTLKTAGPYDLWLHTKDIPGSHVIIVTNRHDVPESTILEAANLAAYHSKARLSSNVPVDYTFKKHVKKPNGAKPGMVIYENNKTIYVTPSQKEIDKIKMK